LKRSGGTQFLYLIMNYSSLRRTYSDKLRPWIDFREHDG